MPALITVETKFFLCRHKMINGNSFDPKHPAVTVIQDFLLESSTANSSSNALLVRVQQQPQLPQSQQNPDINLIFPNQKALPSLSSSAEINSTDSDSPIGLVDAAELPEQVSRQLLHLLGPDKPPIPSVKYLVSEQIIRPGDLVDILGNVETEKWLPPKSNATGGEENSVIPVLRPIVDYLPSWEIERSQFETVSVGNMLIVSGSSSGSKSEKIYDETIGGVNNDCPPHVSVHRVHGQVNSKAILWLVGYLLIATTPAAFMVSTVAHLCIYLIFLVFWLPSLPAGLLFYEKWLLKKDRRESTLIYEWIASLTAGQSLFPVERLERTGFQVLSGRVRPLNVIRAPLSREPCVGYKLIIWETIEGYQSIPTAVAVPKKDVSPQRSQNSQAIKSASITAVS